MISRNSGLAWCVAGGLGSIVLGLALIPLRSFAGTSSLAILMVVFTVLIAGLGGRGAGVVTAIAAALSFDFFLVEPQFSLAIESRRDVIT